jgi:SAM-dependent methyltransferase
MTNDSTSGPADFYDRLAPFYHLIYPDWEASVARQGAALDAIVRERLAGAETVLDVACGIGTQAIGMARLGYRATASDLSPGAVRRADEEAERLGVEINFSVADMRRAHEHHGRTFDVVICCDNSLPHLLSDAEILDALREMHACTRPGGLCLVSLRDYAAMAREGTQVQPYGVRDVDGARFVVLQTRDFTGDRYAVTFYVIEDRGGDTAAAHVMRATYYAVTIDRVMEMIEEAGFERVERIDGAFFQPVVAGFRAE